MNLINSNFVELSGIDGSNPLGFLSALGAVVSLYRAGERQIKLRWEKTTKWTPVLVNLSSNSSEEITEKIVNILRGQEVSENAQQVCKMKHAAFDKAKKEMKKKEGKELETLQSELQQKRADWLQALKEAVPSPELALGKSLDCTMTEYREHGISFLVDSDYENRATLDFMSCFASDACAKEIDEKITPTPFCFISGAGNQYFLDTVSNLIKVADRQKIKMVLLEPWLYQDEKYSLRWDPLEDRRYALMEKNPTSHDNKSKTEWMANLLAYQALVLFPSMPMQSGLKTTAWYGEKKDLRFIWPIWDGSLGLDPIRSLLQMDLSKENELLEYRQKGVLCRFSSRKLRNDKFFNFTPVRTL